MYTLFNEPRVVTTPAHSSARFNYTKVAHRANLERVRSFYRRNSRAVRSDHLLVQLLQHLSIDFTQDLVMFRDRISDLTDELVRAFELTSSVNVGKARFPGVFFGDDSEEVIIVSTEEFPLESVRNDWENLSPIRFLRHPKTDLNLTIPDGQGYSAERGVGVVLINLPLLACQYRQWRIREMKLNPDNMRTAMQFVANYPLPNSLESLMDVAFLNRTVNLFYHRESPRTPSNHPFFLNTRDEDTDKGMQQMLEMYERRRLSFSELLQIISPINALSYQEVIALPKMPHTRQVTWALALARLPTIAFLLHWGEVSGVHRSHQEVNRIKRNLRQLANDRTLDAMGTMRFAEDARRFIDTEIRPFL